MINWKVRFKNRNFWLALVPALLLLLQSGAALAGVELELGALQGRLWSLLIPAVPKRTGHCCWKPVRWKRWKRWMCWQHRSRRRQSARGRLW